MKKSGLKSSDFFREFVDSLAISKGHLFIIGCFSIEVSLKIPSVSTKTVSYSKYESIDKDVLPILRPLVLYWIHQKILIRWWISTIVHWWLLLKNMHLLGQSRCHRELCLVYQKRYSSRFGHVWKNVPKECQFRVPYLMFWACCVVSHRVHYLAFLFSQRTHDLLVSLLGGLELRLCWWHTVVCVTELKVPQHWRIWNTALLTLCYGWPKITRVTDWWVMYLSEWFSERPRSYLWWISRNEWSGDSGPWLFHHA